MQGEATHEEPLEGYAKYRHLKANVGRRRAAYIWIFLLALIVLGAAAAHIALVMESPMSDTDNMIMYAVYGALGILFLWALLLLFSGKRPVEEEAYVPREMERTLLQCPECKSTFQFGEQNFSNNQRTAFSCPVCGAFGKLPDPTQEPVKVLRPEGDYKELRYHCTNCNEDLAVGTFGATPLHLVRFRACPHCGEKGHIERIQGVVGTPPAPEEEWS
jgi:Zn finger protein HypA/HybF involved in hydrogenase expression